MPRLLSFRIYPGRSWNVQPHRTPIANCFSSRRFKMAEKDAGNINSKNGELVFLANAVRESTRRRLNMQLLLNNLVARRRRVLNVACLLLLLISQRNITVPRSVIRSYRRLNKNNGLWARWGTSIQRQDSRNQRFRVSRATLNFVLNRIKTLYC